MTTEDAKSYLSRREIPQLFESLMTGLMYHRPEDHITYLQNCLQGVREKGLDNVRWNLFIEQRNKTPLPPIRPGSGGNGRVQPPPRDPSYLVKEHSDVDGKRMTPLPPIGQAAEPDDSPRTPTAHGTSAISDIQCMDVPKCPIVLVMGGPGSGRATQCKKLVERYSGWVHLSMGDLLRNRIFEKGSADDKWGAIGDLVSHGQMAPEDVTIDLVRESIQQWGNATGIIIEGYPRTMQQVEEYDRLVGKVDLAFVLDCEEYYSTQRLLERGQKTGNVADNLNALASRFAFYKENTLPVIKHFDDQGKVVVIDGDRDVDEIFFDLAVLFDNLFYSKNSQFNVPPQSVASAPPLGDAPKQVSPRPPSGPKPASPRPGSRGSSRRSSTGRPGSGSFKDVPNPITPEVADTGRVDELNKCPLVIVYGGPGSGTDVYSKKLADKLGVAHIQMSEDVSVDALVEKIKENGATKGFILENFPRTKTQVEQFNKQIGGVSYAVCLDTEESHMNKHGLSGDETSENLAYKIAAYKRHTLPVIGHYEDSNKLLVINAERSETEVYSEFSSVLEKHLTSQPAGE